jgi:phosphoribosylanthranilate isomerase
VFVKICGITSEEDALLAVAMGADAIGFVFAPSPRQMAPNKVRDIAGRLPPEILTVGVFRDQTAQQVTQIVHTCGLKAAQLHGRETSDTTKAVRQRVGLVIKGLPAGDPALEHWDEFGADALLLDAPRPGSGQVFDWSLADGIPLNRKVILAGGLTPENVADGIEAVRPWGVDVSSGVESAPGRKDATKVRAFIRAARDAAPEEEYLDRSGRAPYDWEAETGW